MARSIKITMNGVLVFGILTIITLQNVQTKEIHVQPERINYPLHAERYSLNYREPRQLKDVWNTIKNSAKKLWGSIKMIILNTKEKINTWLQNVKAKAKDVVKRFEERVQQIKEKSKHAIDEIVGTGHLVKECIKKDSANIEQILKQIMNDVTTCISANLTMASHLLDIKATDTVHGNNLMEEHTGYQFNDVNGSKLMAEIENSLNSCLERTDSEECMLVVKKEFFGKMENIESDILKHRTESRSKVDDLLDSIIVCSVNGLLGASNVIAAETVHVISCVMKAMNGTEETGSEEAFRKLFIGSY